MLLLYNWETKDSFWLLNTYYMFMRMFVQKRIKIWNICRKLSNQKVFQVSESPPTEFQRQY